MYADHHFTVIYLQICVLCVCLVITSTLFYLYTCIVVCCVSKSSLYCNIPSDLCTLCLSCYYFYIGLSLHLYCCYVVYTDHHFTVIYLQICVLCVCLVITSTLFYLYTCIVVCWVTKSSIYSNIPSDLCTLCLSCYYFYIVLSLYLYCCYVAYPDHYFTIIYLQTCVLCICLVITSTLFYLYTCIVVVVVYPDHYFTVIYLQTSLLCVCHFITSTLFYLYTCTVDMLCIQIIISL